MKDAETTEDAEKESEPVKSEALASKENPLETIETKQEKKDDLLSADHNPDTPIDKNKPENEGDKDNLNIKDEKEKDRSPRKIRSKSSDRSR